MTRPLLILATLALALNACGEEPRDGAPPPTTSTVPATAPQPGPTDADCVQQTTLNPDGTVRTVSGGAVPVERGVTIDHDALTSLDDTYRLTVTADPTHINTNQLFELRAAITDADGRPLTAADVSLSIDAAMPHHEHGLNTTPRVSPTDDTFLCQGIIFHMPGRWELYFDIEDRGITERAILELMVR